MKRTYLTVTLALLLAGIGGAARGQSEAAVGSGTLVSTSVSMNDSTDAALAAESPDGCCPHAACGCGLGAEPWKLPQPCLFQQWGINMGGWIQQGLTVSNKASADGFNGPITTNDFDAGQYQMNQAWVYFMRPTKTDGCGWDVGGRIDMIYGTDWRFGECYGLEDRINGSGNSYGLVLPQFYLEVAVNDLTVKMGHFATMTSYEVVPAVMNFFYSHSYLMAGYFDPLLVTGLQADYKLNDNWTGVAGFNRGWMMFEDPTGDTNFLGGVKWLSDDKRTNLSVMVDAGSQLGFTGNHDRTSVITLLGHQLTERLKYGSQYTVGREPGGSTVTRGGDANWYGMDQYLFYNLNACWSAGMRYEWVRDEDGARIAGIGNRPATEYGWKGLPGFTGSFHALTMGLNYRPHPNFVLRPEIRWDWYDGPTNPAGQLPFETYTAPNLFTTAMDLIVTF